MPYNYVEVYECLAEDDQQQGGEERPPVNRSNSYRHAHYHSVTFHGISMFLNIEI